MSNVTTLITRPERDAAANRDELIRHAREDVAAFGADLDFDAAAWDVTRHCPKPAGKAAQKAVLYFATHDNGTAKSMEGRTALPEPFGSVIKAIVRLKKEGNPKLSDGPINKLIAASRSLALTLADRGYDPCRLVPADFDNACEIVAGRGGTGASRYRLGLPLQEISSFLSRYQVTNFAFQWRNTFERVANNTRVGKNAEKNRAKVVSDDVLDEIARLSHLVASHSDRMLMAGTKLFHCAPWRMGEVNTIPDDPWVTQPKSGPDGAVLDPNGVPVLRHGIRYWPEKSDRPDIKWIPDVMVPVARDAIDTLVALSQPARAVAAWYECNPGRAWLPGPDLGPDQRFTPNDLVQMFSLSHRAGMQWLRTRHTPLNETTRPYTVTRCDLEAALLRDWEKLTYLTKDRRGLPRSKHLFLTLANQHHATRGVNPCMLDMTTDQHFSDFLSGRGSDGDRVKSVFERFGSHDAEGAPMRVNSHQFRHWLNTVAQRGGLGPALVARWSGRKEIAQNDEYDHMTGMELGEEARDLMSTGKVHGALADVHAALPPVRQEDFRDLVFETAHVTEIGMCDGNFISTPCPELGACPTCEHCHVRKGDGAARERTLRVRDDTEWLLERSIEEVADETEGASNYVEAHRQRLDGLDRIIAIHDNPAIPDGTWVRPNAESLDHFAGAALKGHG